MIFGIGTDIVRVSRLRRDLERFGVRFAERILTDDELAEFHQKENKAHFLARRFAAKEAAAKAMGTGFAVLAAARSNELLAELAREARASGGTLETVAAAVTAPSAGGIHESAPARASGSVLCPENWRNAPNPAAAVNAIAPAPSMSVRREGMRAVCDACRTGEVDSDQSPASKR